MQRRRLRGNTYTTEISNLYAGGLLTINLVFLQQLFSGGASSPGIYIADLAFSIAVPALAGILVTNTIQARFPYQLEKSMGSRLLQLVFVLGILTSLIGIGGVLWSVSPTVVVAFGASLLFTSVIVLFYVSTLSHKP